MKWYAKVTPQTSRMIQEIGFTKGVKWRYGGEYVTNTQSKYLCYDNRIFTHSDELTESMLRCRVKLSVGSFIDKLLSLPKKLEAIEVKLNEEYTAIVSTDHIRVGCQYFPLSVVNDLQKAIEQINQS